MNTVYSDITPEMNEILAVPSKDGDILEKRYRILSQGAGGQGRIYYCFDLWSQVPCVLKAVRLPNPEDSRMESAILNQEPPLIELQKLLSLPSHKNVVKLYRLEQIQSEYYLAMEWLPNSLNSLLAAGNPVPVRKTARIALSVCLGMIHCQKHLSQPEKPFAHGNLKPSNLLFTRDGDVKITDFKNTVKSDVRNDIFCLGKIMDELLFCGKREHQALSGQEEKLELIIRHCMAEQPQDRLSTFEKLRDALLDFLHLPSDFCKTETGCKSPEEKTWLKVQACDQAILGNYQKAEQILSRLLASGEESNGKFLAGACCSLGDVYRSQNMYERALPLYEKAIVYDRSQNSYLWTKKGIALRCLDRREESFECFRRALTMNPYDFPALQNEIDILRSQGRTHELKRARVLLFSLYKKQPESEELLKQIGNVCYALKDFAPARTCFRRYLKYNKNDWETIYHYAMCLYLDRDVTHGRRYFQTAVRMMEEDKVTEKEQSKLMYLSISLYHLGDYHGSMEYLDKYRRNFGSSSQTRRLKLLLELDCQLQEKYGSLLFDAYRRLTSVIFAKDPQSHYQPILDRLTAMKEYLERSKITQTLAGHACDMYLSCLDYLMACYEGLGNTEQASACCDRILYFDRSLPEGLYNKGRILLLSEKAYESLPYFQSALRFLQDPDAGRQIEESLSLAQRTVKNSAECRNLFLEEILSKGSKSERDPDSLQRILKEKAFFLTEDFPDMLKTYAEDRIKNIKSSFCAAASPALPVHNDSGSALWNFLLQVRNLADALRQIPGESKDICASGALGLYQLLEEYAAETKSDFTEHLTAASKDAPKAAPVHGSAAISIKDKAIFADANTELGDLLLEKYLDAAQPQEMLNEAAKCYRHSLNYYRRETFPEQYASLMLRMSILMEKRYRLLKDHSLLLARIYFDQVVPADLPAHKKAEAMYRRIEQALQ